MKRKKSVPTYESSTFLGTVVQLDIHGSKKISIDHPAFYQHFVKNVCKAGDKVAMIITNRRPTRTKAQNSYMHLYFTLIAESSGHTKEEIKAWAKGKFLSNGITEVFGNKVRIVKDTARLNISEMCEFINRVEEETGVPSPNPEPFNLPMTRDEYGKLKEQQRQEYANYKPKIT